MRKLVDVSWLLGLAIALAGTAGCPDAPYTQGLDDVWVPGGDVAPDGADVFVALAVDRVFESVGDPIGGERVAIYGAGFTKGARVTFGGVDCAGTLVLDDTQINCNVPAHDPGLVDIHVELLDGQEATLEQAYLYRGPMELVSVTPTSDTTRGGADVTITGAGFTEATRILIGGRLLQEQTLVDDTTIEGIVPARLQGRDGPVAVVASDGFEQRVLVRAFEYVDTLRATWISPTAGPTAGGAIVTLFGSGLSEQTVVWIGDKTAETLVVGGGASMTVRVPPGPEGAVDVLIDNGLETLLLEGAFAYRNEELPPSDGVTLLGVWPPDGGAGGGSQVSLAVAGLPSENAAKGLGVTFNGVPAEVIEVRPAEGVVVVAVPEGSPGPVEITVDAAGDKATRGDLFTYRADFAVQRVSPASGATGGGNTVTIEGVGLAEATEVLFGGAEADIVEANGGGVKVRVPEGVPGRVDVRVRRDSDQPLLLEGAYEYRADAGQLLAVTSPDGSQSGGRLLRLHGVGFQTSGLPEVTVGGEPVEATLIDDATLHVRAPRGEVGSVNVAAGDLGRIAMSYRYFDPTANYGGTSGGTIPEALNITVLDAVTREPIPEAFVILWDDLGTPYQSLTDDRGQLTFSDEGFGPPQMVTAGKDNHTTSSVVDFDSRNVTLFLVSFTPSPPGGGGGPGPQTLPPGELEGDIFGVDKYIVLPPGNCDYKDPSTLPGSLCEECQTDADCVGEGARCTDLGVQGGRCTTPCTTNADCEAGFTCVGVGAGAVQCVPSPGQREVWCGTTRTDLFDWEDDGTGVEEPTISGLPTTGFANGKRNFQIGSDPGEKAVVCLGGYYEPDAPEKTFVATVMGVRRHVFALAGDTVNSQDVKLDIPLTRTLRIRLDDAPVGSGKARNHEVDVFLDFGSDGVFRMPSRGAGIDQNEFELHHFPAKFEESLYDVSYTIYAKALSDGAAQTPPTSNDASYVLHQNVTNLEDDSIFELLPGGVQRTKTGLTVDIHGMHGDGSERVWAVGSNGSILASDGTWWGLQLTPTTEDLHGIYAGGAKWVWAVGDRGTVLFYDGLEWKDADLPRSLDDVNWWGVAGAGADVWLWGDQGLWLYDGVEVRPMLTDAFGRPQIVRGGWSAGPDDVWFVGDSGLIRHWTGDGFEPFDVPGSDLMAVSGTGSSDVWAVGRDGRIIHWDGTVWFDFVPRTRRTLHAVHAAEPNLVWAVGDAGVVMQWDGLQWEVFAQLEHADLRAVRVSGTGKAVTGGLHTLILGPFLTVPTPINPGQLGGFTPRTLRWDVGNGAVPSWTYVQMTEANGFPFWTLFVNGARQDVPLPDLAAAWGLDAIWQGPGFLRLVRIYMPGETIDRYDHTQLNQLDWRSWSMADFDASWVP